MISILLSLTGSVLVGVLLKLAKKQNINFLQIIGWNYLTALLLTHFMFSPEIDLENLDLTSLVIILLLSVLLPTIFFAQALSIKHIGIAKTDIVQRLSLFIGIIAAFFLFKESIDLYKVIGIILAFIAIYFTLYREEQVQHKGSWKYPVLVFLGFGTIDVMFKGIAIISDIKFTILLSVVFLGALILSVSFNISNLVLKTEQFSFKSIPWGIVLGVLNFFNIYFYIKAHTDFSDNPSVVFAVMNLGVIVLGSLVGVVAFKEKLYLKNYIGLGIALIAIAFMVFAQMSNS